MLCLYGIDCLVRVCVCLMIVSVRSVQTFFFCLGVIAQSLPQILHKSFIRRVCDSIIISRMFHVLIDSTQDDYQELNGKE